MIKATVFYPAGDGTFDTEYYLNSHIPFAEKLMKPYGLVRIDVDKGIGGGKPGEASLLTLASFSNSLINARSISSNNIFPPSISG